jgi:enoyl-[acyl-carrier protein] reductase I
VVLLGAFRHTSGDGYRWPTHTPSNPHPAFAGATAPLMEEHGGSIVTLSYLGGERVVPHYNVMGVAKAALEMSVRYLAADLGPRGIRVNAISAGPIKTLAASGVHGLSKMLEYHRTHAPLRKNTEQDEVGDAGLFLVSPLSRGLTGEVIHVDGGFHVMGMAAL